MHPIVNFWLTPRRPATRLAGQSAAKPAGGRAGARRRRFRGIIFRINDPEAMLDHSDLQPVFFAPFVSSQMRIEPQWIDYNGHLNMAYYNVLFDRAVDELYELAGIGADYLKKRHHSFFAAEVHIRYLRELHADDPVKDFPDLNGRTVTAAVGMTWIPYIQQKYGIKFGLVPTSYGLASFLVDRSVIQQCFLTSEPYFARQKGVAVRVLPLTATGYDIYHAVICRRELLRKEPDIVRAFVAASIRGWQDYITNDPAPAHQLILTRNRDMTAGQLAYSRQALIEHALVGGYADRGEATGRLSLERIQQEIDRLREFGVLEKPLRADEVATKAYLPAQAK